VRVIDLNLVRTQSKDFSIKIEGQCVPALIDTGAQVNAVSAQWANVRAIIPTAAQGILIKDAQNNFMPLIGTVELNVSYDDHNSKELFYIIDHLSKDVLLGQPWCQKHQVNISYASGGAPEITFGSQEYKSDFSKYSRCYRSPISCILDNNIVIPAEKGCFVNVIVNTNCDTVLVSSVQCLHPKRHYITPRSILKVVNNKSQVFVVNLSKNDIRFSKGTHLGIVEEREM
jgi:hypothetical protein